ncbi:MAG: hypothetical protein Q9200_002221 [Gallowayella weberi]
MSGASSSSSAPSRAPAYHPAVREISLTESDAAADSLALAFADDDVAMYFVKMIETEGWTDEERWNMHVRIMRSIVNAHCLKGLVLTIGPNYDCVALWMPPGTNMDDTLTMFDSSMWRMSRKLSDEGHYRFQREFLPLLHKTKEEVLGSLDNDSWYLVYIGTKPDSRGKGYAKQLIEFYRKLGFETEKTIHLTRGPKPVELEVMVRKPLQRDSSTKTSTKFGPTIKRT